MEYHRPKPGCLIYLLAYGLAFYALTVPDLFLEDSDYGFVWILLAPLSAPIGFLLGFLLIGNSELPMERSTMINAVGIFFFFSLERCFWFANVSFGLGFDIM